MENERQIKALNFITNLRSKYDDKYKRPEEPLVVSHDYESYKHLIGSKYHQYLNREEVL